MQPRFPGPCIDEASDPMEDAIVMDEVYFDLWSYPKAPLEIVVVIYFVASSLSKFSIYLEENLCEM